MTLRITEIFYSLQGETRTSGLPTVFVRLTGCPLRCQYCDTAYAFSGGEVMTLDAIVERVASYNPRYVCVTGGEPLAQPNCVPLLERLYRQRWCALSGLGAVVVSPTRELALQIFEVLRLAGARHDFAAGLVIGGKDKGEEQIQDKGKGGMRVLPGYHVRYPHPLG